MKKLIAGLLLLTGNVAIAQEANLSSIKKDQSYMECTKDPLHKSLKSAQQEMNAFLSSKEELKNFTATALTVHKETEFITTYTVCVVLKKN